MDTAIKLLDNIQINHANVAFCQQICQVKQFFSRTLCIDSSLKKTSTGY